MASDPKVTFELKEGTNRVEIALQGSDKHLVTESSYTTSDAEEIAALDANPGVKRVSKSDAKSEAPAGGASK